MENLKAIIECLLFVTDEPLTVDRLKEVLPLAAHADIRRVLVELGEEYDKRGGGFYLKEIAGGYQLRSRPEYREWVQELVKPSPVRLSRAALETLAIIAYKQPIIRADVEHIRGVDSGGVLRMLLEKKLIRVLGRKDIPGRPMIYATTKRFLELFELKDLRDLPTPKEFESLGSTEEPAIYHQAELPLPPNVPQDCLTSAKEGNDDVLPIASPRDARSAPESRPEPASENAKVAPINHEDNEKKSLT
ncbi:MAG: SMC-Scp complex subunit ScpB [Desulfobacterales bacterium]